MYRMKSVILIILLSSIVVMAQMQTDIPWPTLAKSAWPMIKHDPQFTGRSPYKGPQTPTVVWAADLKDGIFSGPVIGSDNNLYFGSYYQLDSADYFYSYTANGILRWKYKLGLNRPPQTGVLIDSSNTIYFGSLDKNVYAMTEDGKLKWKFTTLSPIPELAVPNMDKKGNIYITSGHGEFYSINPQGVENWHVIYEGGFLSRSAAISPDGQTLYIAGKDSNLFALNLDGTLKWKFSCGKLRKFPLVDSDGKIYFLPEEIPQKLYCIKSEGIVAWATVIVQSSVIPAYSAPAIDYSGNIYIALGSALFSYSPGGVLRWYYIIGENPNDYDEFWQPLVCDKEGTIYFGSTFGKNFYAISSSGSLKWKLPLYEYQVDNTGAIAEDGTLYLGVHKSSLYPNLQRTLIAIRDTGTVGVTNAKHVHEYALDQNYPNPFNPSTVISYQLPKAGLVTVKVYDMLGKEVQVLVNEYKESGKYTVEFNGAGLASGVYVYRLDCNDFHATKKLTLLK